MVLGTRAFVSYGWGLFVALPFCLGLGAVLLYAYHGPRGFWRCMGVACMSTLLLGVALLALALEGLICLLMALPLALPLAAMGGTVGYFIQRNRPTMRAAPSTLMLLMLFVPGWMSAERGSKPAPIFAVHTAVEVDAPPEAVWRRLMGFASIPPPTEWLFRLGIAYPTRATIAGRGVGAQRHCEFDTGAFVEPIRVWDEPHRLRFSVTSSPPPMQEWTPYKEIHPRHLAGFLVAREGEFLLVPLPGGRSRLEGTTWYQHNMWPASYWRLWSDTIIHRIHGRVLRYIKRRAEADVTIAPGDSSRLRSTIYPSKRPSCSERCPQNARSCGSFQTANMTNFKGSLGVRQFHSRFDGPFRPLASAPLLCDLCGPRCPRCALRALRLRLCLGWFCLLI
jgi:hypothetical protein